MQSRLRHRTIFSGLRANCNAILACDTSLTARESVPSTRTRMLNAPIVPCTSWSFLYRGLILPEKYDGANIVRTIFNLWISFENSRLESYTRRTGLRDIYINNLFLELSSFISYLFVCIEMITRFGSRFTFPERHHRRVSRTARVRARRGG